MATVNNPNEQLEFELGQDEVATDVAVGGAGEDTSAQASAEASQSNADTGQELDQISDAVQKRISKLTARMREAERREQAAIEYAKGLQNQTQTLQQKLVHTDYSRLSEAKARLETQTATLKAIIKKARDENDVDTEMEAQERLTNLSMEHRQVAGWLQDQEHAARSNQQQVQQQYAPQQQQTPQRPTPSPKAEAWASENEWFGKDRTMTYAAWGIHQTLVEDEGVDPNSDDYYTELNRRLREEFPTRFRDSEQSSQSNRQQRSAPAVAPASRGSGVNSARRTVRLTPSQVAIAKKLGVPLEEYAKYVKE